MVEEEKGRRRYRAPSICTNFGGLSFEEYRRKQEELFSNYLSSHVLLVQLSDNAKGNSNCGVDFGNFLLQKSHNYFANIIAW